MDECIHNGVSSTEPTLPGRMKLRRRAPMLYRRLMRGFYPGGVGLGNPYSRVSAPIAQAAIGSSDDGDAEAIASELHRAGEDGKGNMEKKIGARYAQRRNRGARIVGAFDHPLLPVPPVRTQLACPPPLDWAKLTINDAAQDDDTGYGLLVLLRDRCK
jgi:hypothetical protein